MKLDRQAALSLASQQPDARLATVGQSGQPHLVPITFAIEEDFIYSMVDSKPKTSRQLKRLSNIEGEPRVSVLTDKYDEDWTQLWWVRLDGAAEIHTEGVRFKLAKQLLTAKYPQYADQPPEGPAIAVEVSAVSWWSW